MIISIITSIIDNFHNHDLFNHKMFHHDNNFQAPHKKLSSNNDNSQARWTAGTSVSQMSPKNFPQIQKNCEQNSSIIFNEILIVMDWSNCIDLYALIIINWSYYHNQWLSIGDLKETRSGKSHPLPSEVLQISNECKNKKS